jgi:hypothetical protein
MKYLLLVCLIVMLAGCTAPGDVPMPPVETIYKDSGGTIVKFKDGEITCYLYNSYGISCLREATTAAEQEVR